MPVHRIIAQMVLFSFLTGVLFVLTWLLILANDSFWVTCDIGIFIGSYIVSKDLARFKRAYIETTKKDK